MKITIIAVFCLFGGYIPAQTLTGITIKATPEVLVAQGDNIPVVLSADFSAKSLHRKSMLLLQPVIRFGGQETMLDPIFFRGEKVAGVTRKVSYSKGSRYLNADTALFIPGMEACELIVIPYLIEKRKKFDEHMSAGEFMKIAIPVEEMKLANGVVTTGRRVLHNERCMLAPHKYTGSLTERRMANLFFGKDDSRIDPDLPMNQVPFVKSQMELLFIPAKIGWQVDTVIITAYTSPEGDSVYNAAVAERRAESGETFIIAVLDLLKINKEPVVFIRKTGGEDWEGLSKTLNASTLPGKEKIVALIDNQPDTEMRLKEIMQESQLYNEVQETFLPMLRRISIRITYRESSRSDQELLHLALQKPELLRFEQLMYAATLTGDPEEKVKIYVDAGNLHPGEWEAPNNAACMYLEMNKPDKAIVYLNKASNLFPYNGFTLNNLAAASLKLERTDKALNYLQLAEKEGVDVSYNRGIYYLLSGNYEEAAEVLEEITCDPNAGLAALMISQTGKAINKLSCSPESAEKYYLLAICEARNRNKQAVASHLTIAVQLNPLLKETIIHDIEFSVYRDESWMKAITNE